jgi:outer membrane immunogenic protein
LRHKLNLIASTALASGVVGFCGAGVAADMPLRVKAAPRAPVFSWTGCYAGVSGGGAWNHTSHRISVPAVAGNGSGTDPAFIAGVGAGCNYQFTRNWVLGAEGDINYVRSSHRFNSAFNGAAFNGNGFGPRGEDTYGIANVFGETRLRWLATLRGRLGVTFDRAFLYATGGLALGGVESSVSASVAHFLEITGPTIVPAAPFGFNGSYSGTRAGAVGGIGLEYAFTNTISGKIEYLHYDLGEVTYLVTGANGGGNLPTVWTASARLSGDIVRVGANVRF